MPTSPRHTYTVKFVLISMQLLPAGFAAQAVVPGWCQEANQSVIEGLPAVPG
jgi:hypothetical protein